MIELKANRANIGAIRCSGRASDVEYCHDEIRFFEMQKGTKSKKGLQLNLSRLSVYTACRRAEQAATVMHPTTVVVHKT